jgi:dTDP-4-dehydrorhamnose 3,5-epimerase-like enzyme
MKNYNIFAHENSDLEIHVDARGRIADAFFGTSINHVAVIDSVKGAIRGNHFHKETVQSILITKGSLEYWYKNLDDDSPAQFIVAVEGDVVTSDKNEIHAMRMLEDSTQFIAFTEGIRGGKNYEKDTYRISNSIIS